MLGGVSTTVADGRSVPESVGVPDEQPAGSASTDTAERQPLIINQASDGLFYVEAKVNGVPVNFVVDTGSSVVVLNGQDAIRAGVGANDSVDVETAGGFAQMQRAEIKHVEFAGQMLTGVDAAIVRRDLKVSLLGQSALSQFASVTFRGRQLELR
jgi:aspartyl protease family protein